MGTKHYPLLSARAILLAMLALMSWCQPALAQDERYPISDVYVESNFASIPALGEKCTQPNADGQSQEHRPISENQAVQSVEKV